MPTARNGNIKNAGFNAPQSLYVYQKSALSLLDYDNMRPIWLKYPERQECLFCNYQNYTKCGVLIDEDFPYFIVDHRRVKYIPFTYKKLPAFYEREGE